MTASAAHEPQSLESLLQQACECQASASLRQVGTSRILGDLQVQSLVAHHELVLAWDNGREQAPAPGTETVLSLVVGERIHTFRTRVIEAVQPHLRVAWPWEVLASAPRAELRVAAPDQRPLDARLCRMGDCQGAALLRLTESGMSVGVVSLPEADMGDRVEVQTELPGGVELRVTCEVAGIHFRVDEPFPVHLDLRFLELPPMRREALQGFLQARRADRSELLRSEG